MPSNPESITSRYLTAEEAARLLSISPATLYSYVSRGLVISEPVPAGGNRERRYPAEDILRLKERQEIRRYPEKAAERALFQGSPVLTSSITQLDEKDFYYRGRNVLQLARERWPIESVALLLWLDRDPESDRLESDALFRSRAISTRLALSLARTAGLSTIQRFASALPSAEASDVTAHDLRPAAAASTGARIFRLLVAIASAESTTQVPTAVALQRAWAPRRPEAATLINAALVLCADHELDAAALAACAAASTGATPYSAVAAGLASGSGPGHIGGCLQAEALITELVGCRRASPDALRAFIADKLKTGNGVPRFGHPIYPKGDPRASVLFELLQKVRPRSSVIRRAVEFTRTVGEVTGLRPRVDIPLAAMAAEFSFAPGTATTLYTLARVIGWIAHAIEQYETGRIIRPRARYVGKTKLSRSDRSAII